MNRQLHRSASAVALAFILGAGMAVPALAQDQTAPATVPSDRAAEPNSQADDSSQIEDVVVSGSRIIADGTDAPTPVEVVGAEQIQTQATPTISSLLSQLPAFAGNLNSNGQATTGNVSASLVGLNLANLRGLGFNRTLILVNGERFVPTLTFGSSSYYAVDLSGIPQQLIQRVETVTGGASAVYGSDAVGGAVNFILDKRFTGFKADLSGGLTTYGDGANGKFDVTWGARFARDRGHIILSGEVLTSDAVNDSSNRKWNRQSYCVMTNPAWNATATVPQRITVTECGETTAPGGVINGSVSNGVPTPGQPLRGITFGVGGVPLPFIYGPLVSTPLMSGGSWHLAADEHLTRGATLQPSEHRQNVYSILTYDLTDKIKATYEFSWGHSSSLTQAQDIFYDSAAGVTIQGDNAFIPPSLRPVIANNNISSFTLSTINGDLPTITGITSRYVTRHSASLDGDFDLFKSNWTWNAYYAYGKTKNYVEDVSVSRSRYARATDAVYAANGSIQCRVNTDASAANDDPACIPYSLFGLGVNSPQAKAYVTGSGIINQQNTQQVVAASLTGKPFSLWAGPVGVAFSAEYRDEKAAGVANDGALNNDLFSGNYKPINGAVNVAEGALEVNIPLAKDWRFAKAANLDLAVRSTNYSSSGAVTTWKVGATWNIVDSVILRGNISRDIRAANLGELFAFAGSPVVSPGLNDKFTNNSGASIRVSARGNPALAPEEGDSYGFGVVFKPDFLPGFSASLDYWNVKVKGQITALTGQQSIDLCFNGNAQACGFLTRSGPATLPGVGAYAGQTFAPIAFISSSYLNLAEVNSSGLDEFAQYRFPLKALLPFDGDVTIRYDGSYYFKGFTNPGIPGAPTSRTASYWRGVLGAQYSVGHWNGGLTARYASPNAYVAATLPQLIFCTTGCPTQSQIPSNVITQDRLIHTSTLFFDANLSHDFTIRGADAQVYLNIRNLFDRDPPILPPTIEPFAYAQTSGGDDALGRIFRVGLRMKL